MPDTDRYLDDRAASSLRVSQARAPPGKQPAPRRSSRAPGRWPLTATMSLRHHHRCNQWHAGALPVVPAAANRAPHRSQDPQDGADDQHDDPKRLKDRDIGDEADDEQDQPENEHAAASSCPPLSSCAEDLADRTLIVPTPKCQSNLAGA